MRGSRADTRRRRNRGDPVFPRRESTAGVTFSSETDAAGHSGVKLPLRPQPAQALNRLDLPVCDRCPPFAAGTRTRFRTGRRRATHGCRLRWTLDVRARLALRPDRTRCTGTRRRARLPIATRWATAPAATGTCRAIRIATARRTALPAGTGTGTPNAWTLRTPSPGTVRTPDAGTIRPVRTTGAGTVRPLGTRMLVRRTHRRPMATRTARIHGTHDHRWRPVVTAAIAIGIPVPGVVASVRHAVPRTAIPAVAASVTEAAVGRAVMTVGGSGRAVVVIATAAAIAVGRTAGQRQAGNEQKSLADHVGPPLSIVGPESACGIESALKRFDRVRGASSCVRPVNPEGRSVTLAP